MKKWVILKEMWDFLKENKKWWLLPIVITFFLVSLLLYMTQTAVVAPFIYTLF